MESGEQKQSSQVDETWVNGKSGLGDGCLGKTIGYVGCTQ